MSSRDDIDRLEQLTPDFVIDQHNSHDVTLCSTTTGHEWIIVSPYDNETVSFTTGILGEAHSIGIIS